MVSPCIRMMERDICRYEPGGSELNRYLRSMPVALLMVFSFALIFTAGCSRDETPADSGVSDSLKVSGIICMPFAPPPNPPIPPDTVISVARLTVRAAGLGTAASYDWEVEAGTLKSSKGISVEWEVPSSPGIYRVSVRASIGSIVSGYTIWVMVRRCEAKETGIRYAFHPNLIDGELYFVGTNADISDRSFLGYHAYKLDNMPPTWIDSINATPPLMPINISGGYDFKFYPDGLLTASVTDGAQHLRMQPMNVIFFPYFAGRNTYWSKNEVAGTTFRRNQNLHPSASSGLDMTVWQRTAVGISDDGKRDLVNVRFRFSPASSAPILSLTTAKDSVYQLGTWVYTYWKNIKPMFTPDDAAIIYFNDSTETFEPCIIPMDGTEPDLAGRRALMVDANHGIFYYASVGGTRTGVRVSENTVFQWNPANPSEVAFIDDLRQFCIFNYVTETVEIIATGLSEFVYSEDGKIAVVAGDGVYILEPGQAVAKLVFAKERATDAVIGVNWSPGLVDQKLGFRMVRKGASTVESYCVLVIYSVDVDRWYYASPEIKPVMGMEPVVNYTWMRAAFDPVTGGMYIPVPLSEGGGKSVLYHSY
jgi:hypothetical protein